MNDEELTPQEIFSNAIEIESVEERKDFLKKACQGDEKLRAKD